LTKTQAKTEYINIVETLKPGFRSESVNKVKKELDDDDIFMTDEEYKQKKDVIEFFLCESIFSMNNE